MKRADYTRVQEGFPQLANSPDESLIQMGYQRPGDGPRREVSASLLCNDATLLHFASDAIISVDTAMVIHSWNRAAERLYGWTRDEAIGCSLPELTGNRGDSDDLNTISRDLVEKGYWQGKVRERHRSGKPLVIWSSVSMLGHPDDGSAVGFVIVNRDITERERVDAGEREQRLLAEALRDTSAIINSSLKLSEILDRILICVERVIPYDAATIMLVEGDTSRVMHGRGFDAMGISQEELLGLRFPIAQFGNLIAMQNTRRPVLIADCRNDSRWLNVTETNWIQSYVGAPIQVDDEVIGVINVDSRVPNAFTESQAEALLAFANQAGIAIRNAQLFEALNIYAASLEERVAQRTAELERERAQLRTILDSISDGVVGEIFDRPPKQFINQALRRMIGDPAAEWSVDYLKPASMTIDEYTQHIYRILMYAQEHGVWRGEKPFHRPDGSEMDVMVTVTTVTNPDGLPIGAVTVIKDISQEKVLQDQKSLFVATASHELRTPITNLITRLYLLRRSPDHLSDHLTILDQTAERLRLLVENLLDYSRYERGAVPLYMEPVDVRGLIENVVLMQKAEAEKKAIHLEFAKSAEDMVLLLDPGRITQVVTNLVVNAINYTEPGGSVRVRLECAEQGDPKMTRIVVQDNGVGIPAEALPHLFQPFYRIADHSVGTGLGLSIAYEIVRLHGGDIHVESQPGEGSQFIVDLPIATAPLEDGDDHKV
ncbi:MAG: PAS domain S-box protein [Anaerolineae bacterium]|nr:PAS domain S-box protein [Anaerolineae bacterium]